ncbi:TRAP transporter large permease [Clostridium formicaceticum]|uniref:Sialic acid TRAP transporter permease protein SiaT n=1 Tax=Clostridium formicaceticum TaxID=1497 RepID=A0AAC9WHZ2_9CLOT|nr:TRAP transporter large permease [Clostridium formicaceticum]AOY77645.1 hypothetical protein BJL90_18360 [Clostridium formicaceticum]ARE88230.1 Sialic acid TRAP transporter permease protein SiaT [Clostridium formicaceticum]
MELATQPAMIMLIAVPILLMIGVPISVSIGLGSTLAMMYILPFNNAMITASQRIFTGTNSFSLLAIPFFILAGIIMNNGGIARRLINCAKVISGRLPGALAQSNVVANMLFGAISGSGVAAAAAVGGTMGPLQEKEGYSKSYSAAVNIASAPSGMLIPPSNTLIVYSTVAGGVSIAALFMAGYIPGILWGLGVMTVAGIFAKKLGYQSTQRPTFKEASAVFIDAIPSLLLIVIVIGGILGGVFTATEGSAISVVYSLALSFVYRSIKVKDLPNIFLETAKMTAIVIFMIGVSSVMSWVMAFTKIPMLIATILLGLTNNPVIILLIMNVVLLVVGTFMDPTPAVLIFTPIFLPIVAEFGMHPVHFGIMLVLNLCIGTITPPVGPILFTGCRIAGLKIEDVVRQLIPYFIVTIVVLLVVTYIPVLTLAIPSWLNLL